MDGRKRTQHYATPFLSSRKKGNYSILPHWSLTTHNRHQTDHKMITFSRKTDTQDPRQQGNPYHLIWPSISALLLKYDAGYVTWSIIPGDYR